MTFATGNAQAGIVIDNSLYVPLNVKLTITYNDNGKLKKETTTSKAVLKDLGYKGYTLAYYIYDYDSETGQYLADVYAIDPKTGDIEDLTEDGIMDITITELAYTDKENNNGSYKYNGTGTLELTFDSDGGLEVPEVVAKTPSLDGYYNFDISGVYSEKYSESADDKNYNYNVKDKLTSKAMSGTGVDTDLDTEDTLPVTGSAKANGSGKLED
jgi:hypothetical protein